MSDAKDRELEVELLRIENSGLRKELERLNRANPMGRVEAVRRLHVAGQAMDPLATYGDQDCVECQCPYPCRTIRVLDGK